MSRPRPLRRILAVAASAAIGLVGAVALTSPAHAHHTYVTGSTDCADPDTREWVIDWKVTSWDPGKRGPKKYQLTKVTSTPDVSVTGLETGAWRHVSETFEGRQVVSGDVDSVTLYVHAKWKNGQKKTNKGKVTRPDVCDVPPAPPAPAQVDAEHSCDGLIVRVHNPEGGEDTTVVLTPSEGETVELPLGPGETLEHLFSGDDGVSVAVTVGDDDAVHYEWTAPEDCDEPGVPDEPGEGEGGGDDEELPLTGSATGMAIIGAVLLLTLGAGLFLLARRRRITFTA